MRIGSPTETPMITRASTTVQLAGVLCLCAARALAADPAARDPMVISMAWSSPDTRYLQQHVAAWEALPFTGTVLFFTMEETAAGNINMSTGDNNASWQVFQRAPIPEEAVERAIRDLQATRFTRSHDNFLEVVSWLSDRQHFDWFDDAWWATVLENMEKVARVAKQGGCRGILLDMEEYGCPFWSWGGDRPHFALKGKDTYKDRTWEETRAQCRRRGVEFIRALNRGFPNCPIWMLYGYSHIIQGDIDSVDDLAECGNALYAAFLDGWLEGSDEGTFFIDGCEGSYRFDHTNPFAELRKVVTEKALKFTAVPEIYRKKMRVGFGLYLDMYNYAESHPWYPDRPQDNYMTPEHLEKAVRIALRQSDGYVWIYNEFPSWWLGSPEATFAEGVQSRDDHLWIPPVYRQAVERALRSHGTKLRPDTAENLALGKPVNDRDDLLLTDGDIHSRTPQIAHAFDYRVDLEGAHRIGRVALYWGLFGRDPDSIEHWELHAELANGESVPLASGEFPGSTETKVALDQDGVVRLRIIGSSSKNWIAMTELAAYAKE